MAYQLYRNTTLGNSLQESLDELIQVTLPADTEPVLPVGGIQLPASLLAGWANSSLLAVPCFRLQKTSKKKSSFYQRGVTILQVWAVGDE